MVVEQSAVEKQKDFGEKLSNLSPKKKKVLYGGVAAFITVALIAASSVLFMGGRHRMEESYQIASQNAYDGIYEAAFQFAEARNHVSNDVNISIGDTKEVSRLEVLAVSGSEYIIKNSDETSKVTSWLEVQGTGIFTVDLAFGEFIVDSDRHYVLVKVPQPELTECTVSGTGKQFWRDGWIIANGSVAEGVRLSQAQLGEGRMKLEESMKQSRRFHEAAQETAIRMIKSLVEEWNPNIPDLQVEVEFIESI